jgi:hypothetical protein
MNKIARAASSLELMHRIDAAEVKLLEHERELHHTWSALRHRWQDRKRPERYLVPATGALVSLGTLWWLARRQRLKHPAHTAESTPRQAARIALPWAELFAIAWPWITTHSRPRITPAAAIALASAALPILQRAFDSLRPRRAAARRHARAG